MLIIHINRRVTLINCKAKIMYEVLFSKNLISPIFTTLILEKIHSRTKQVT